MITWDVYEVSSNKHPLHGVKCRGRIRKFAVQNELDLLVENASDKENVVRVAFLTGTDTTELLTFLKTIWDDVALAKIQENLPNPVISKMKINILERYEI